MAFAQTPTPLDTVLNRIEQRHPLLRVSDARIRSLEEAAKGARNWEAPELGTGLWMVPYSPALWKKGMDGTTGMGQYALTAQQTFPNRKKQNAETAYLQAASSVEIESKNTSLNELFAEAKTYYYQWQTDLKKDALLARNERVLTLLISDAETRYKNGIDQLGAYYKAKAALGSLQNMRLDLADDMVQKKIALNTLMFRDGDAPLGIDTLARPADRTAIVVDETRLSASRSDIKAVDRNIALTALKEETEKSSSRPEFGLRMEHLFGFGGLPMQYSLMGMVKIPFSWTTKTQKANLESLKWETEALRQQKQTLLSEANGKIAGLKNQIATRKKQLSLFESSILPALRKNYQATQLAYRQNTQELQQVYDAWQSWNAAELNYLDQSEQLLLLLVEYARVTQTR